MADSVGVPQRLRQATRDKLQAIQFTEESTLSDRKQEEAFRVIDRAPLPAVTPERLPAFENLVRMLGSNAAMVLGGYADPRTGQPMIDPDAARELIDMLDALHQKTKGNLSPEEDELLLDLLGKLKMTYLEINQAVAAEAAKAKAKARP